MENNIDYTDSVVNWKPLIGATLYEVQVSREPVIDDYISIYKGKKTNCVYPPKLIGGIRIRVRGRVEGKWLQWSKEYIHAFTLYVSVNIVFSNGTLSWQSDPFSEISEIQIAKKDTDVFETIFSGIGTFLLHSPEAGEWIYRVRNSRGIVHSEWVYLDIFINHLLHDSNNEKKYVFSNYYMRDDAELNAFGVKRETPMW